MGKWQNISAGRPKKYNFALSPEFVRGLVVGEGTFYFDSRPKPGGIGKYKYPAFCLKMHVRDEELVRSVRNMLKLEEPVRIYKHGGRHYAMLIVRNFGDIKNIIIPFFYKKLWGFKADQFKDWLEKFSDPDIRPDCELIYRLYKKGYYDNPKNHIYKWD
ncbi:MAG: LAGLIDADG family homing endonuclease [Parcubacteria group bacterium]|nr:LAGLIDADG family homing endonuclease [Parcubacteria group bacterium]